MCDMQIAFKIAHQSPIQLLSLWRKLQRCVTAMQLVPRRDFLSSAYQPHNFWLSAFKSWSWNNLGRKQDLSARFAHCWRETRTWRL